MEKEIKKEADLLHLKESLSSTQVTRYFPPFSLPCAMLQTQAIFDRCVLKCSHACATYLLILGLTVLQLLPGELVKKLNSIFPLFLSRSENF